MRCKHCRGAAVMEVRRHNAAFCRDCFLHYVGQQVTGAIAKYRMLGHTDRVLVAVSGGKDSLALWDLLLELGYQVGSLYYRPRHRRLLRALPGRLPGVRGRGSPAAGPRPGQRARLHHPRGGR